ILAVLEFLDVIGQTTLAHLFSILQGGAGRGGVVLQSRDQLIHVFFQHVRPNNKHYFVASLHVISNYLVASLQTASESVVPEADSALEASRSARKSASRLFLNFTSRFIRLVLAIKPVHRPRDAFVQNHVYSLFSQVESFIDAGEL